MGVECVCDDCMGTGVDVFWRSKVCWPDLLVAAFVRGVSEPMREYRNWLRRESSLLEVDVDVEILACFFSSRVRKSRKLRGRPFSLEVSSKEVDCKYKTENQN